MGVSDIERPAWELRVGDMLEHTTGRRVLVTAVSVPSALYVGGIAHAEDMATGEIVPVAPVEAQLVNWKRVGEYHFEWPEGWIGE